VGFRREGALLFLTAVLLSCEDTLRKDTKLVADTAATAVLDGAEKRAPQIVASSVASGAAALSAAVPGLVAPLQQVVQKTLASVEKSEASMASNVSGRAESVVSSTKIAVDSERASVVKDVNQVLDRVESIVTRLEAISDNFAVIANQADDISKRAEVIADKVPKEEQKTRDYLIEIAVGVALAVGLAGTLLNWKRLSEERAARKEAPAARTAVS
jgi:hypothetical protein